MNSTEQVSFILRTYCATYNHENYIMDAMNGFAIQQTTFPVVFTIVDDASTDKTSTVIKHYVSELMEIIFNYLQSNNVAFSTIMSFLTQTSHTLILCLFSFGNMQAIILAAGMGRRLGEYTHDNTKCMLEVNGVRLIDRALDTLNSIGVSRVVLVVGYKGQNVKDYVGPEYKGTPVVYVDNPVYDRTNNIYSLYLAKDYMLEEDTLLLESDLIYEPSVVKKLLQDARGGRVHWLGLAGL